MSPMKRDSYDDEIPCYCEDCDLDFTIEGYIQDSYLGDEGNTYVIVADGKHIFCPNDTIKYPLGPGGHPETPTHDVSVNL
jgi:hypothetical protein